MYAPSACCLPLLQVGVSPENGPEVVERAARALGMPADTVFRLRLPEGNPHQLSTPPACAQCLLPVVLSWWIVAHIGWWSTPVGHSFFVKRVGTGHSSKSQRWQCILAVSNARRSPPSSRRLARYSWSRAQWGPGLEEVFFVHTCRRVRVRRRGDAAGGAGSPRGPAGPHQQAGAAGAGGVCGRRGRRAPAAPGVAGRRGRVQGLALPEPQPAGGAGGVPGRAAAAGCVPTIMLAQLPK